VVSSLQTAVLETSWEPGPNAAANQALLSHLLGDGWCQ